MEARGSKAVHFLSSDAFFVSGAQVGVSSG